MNKRQLKKVIKWMMKHACYQSIQPKNREERRHGNDNIIHHEDARDKLEQRIRGNGRRSPWK